MAAETAVAVTLWALWRGTELAGAGTIALASDAIALSASGARLVVPVGDLDGAHIEPTHLTLFHGSGDIVELTASTGLPAMGRAIIALACEVPELTVPLKALGSTRARPGIDHDRFFGPFLAARRAAARAAEPDTRLAAVDPAALAAGVGRVVQELATERYPKQPAERRAMEAELADLAQPVVESLDRLGAAADAARSGPDDSRFSRWRDWSAAYRDVFRAADRCWLQAIESALGPRTVKSSRWGRGNRM
jgi:hypothetical protein